MGEELEKKIPRRDYVETILMSGRKEKKKDFRCFSLLEGNTSINSPKRSVCEMTILG